MKEIVEATASFIAKQSVVYCALDTVRQELETMVAIVAQAHFGSLVAPFIARQVAIVASVPVTCFYSELVSVAVQEAIRTIIDIAASLLGYYKPKGLLPFCREQALYIAGCVAGFFAKSYFCTFALPAVHELSACAIRQVALLSGVPSPIASILPHCAVVISPYVTFMFGDIVWFVVAEVVEEIGDNLIECFS